MPVWNGQQYVRAAIESILNQTFPDFEFIVVDDGSTDGTREILRSYEDARLRVFHLEHAGIVPALNFGVDHSKAEWIARQDADDLSQPDRLQRQWSRISASGKAVLCHTDFEFIEGDGPNPPKATFPRSRALVALKLCFQCPIVHSTVLFQKSAFRKVGGYRVEERHAEDFALWGRLAECGQIVGMRAKLLCLRQHPGSVSKQNVDAQSALTQKIAVEHCRRFMDLTDCDAKRAHRILATRPEQRHMSEWFWFLHSCVPRLRWWSGELFTWLLLQTLRTIGRKRAL
jgi:glycosyltransferase involved in cell wall biosynthesis